MRRFWIFVSVAGMFFVGAALGLAVVTRSERDIQTATVALIALPALLLTLRDASSPRSP